MNSARSPGAGPLTWVTLGLLVCSWLVITVDVADAFIRRGGLWSIRHEAVLLCFFGHAVCGLTAWFGRGYFVIRVGAFVFSLAYLGIGTVNSLLLFQPAVAARLGLSMWMLDPWAYYVVALGLVTGIPTLIWVRWTTRTEPAVEGE